MIDFLRLVSAVYVALYHFQRTSPYVDNWYRHFCNQGKWGVVVFFVISGYCIGLAKLHVKTATEFLVRRLFRILPPYWFSLMIVLLCVLILRLITGYNSVTVLPKTIGGIAATLGLYTSPLSHYTTINWVYWTLSYELFFYVVVFLSMLAGKKYQLILPALLLVLSIVLPIPNTGPLFFLNEFPVFMIGHSLFVLIENKKPSWSGWLLMCLALCGTMINQPGFTTITICLVSVAFIYAGHKFPVGDNFISRLGDYSYSFYLLHVPICMYLLGFVRGYKSAESKIPVNMITDLTMITLVLLISLLSFRYVELPSIRLGKELGRRARKTI